MKFVLFCEGPTEQSALPNFLHRWLDPQLSQKVGIQPVLFPGWPELVKESPKKARFHLLNPDVIAVVSLLDLYGPTFYPDNCKEASDRFNWAKAHLEKPVGDRRFIQYFAVHELEAWILSQPELLPPLVGKKFQGKILKPELVNFNEPPASLLNRIYKEATGRGYKKRVYGEELFRKLDPLVVREKCPYFRKFADELLELANNALKPKK